MQHKWLSCKFQTFYLGHMRQRIYLRIHCDLDNDDYYNNVTMAPDYDDHYELDFYDDQCNIH